MLLRIHGLADRSGLALLPAGDGHLVKGMSADFRGNTDESWSRALDWLVRNRLLAQASGAGR